MTEETIDLDAIDIYLIGNEEEMAEGIRQIDDNFKEKIVGIIRKRAPSANLDDLFDIYQETLLGIYKYARSGEYDPGPNTLISLIYKIATNKALDWLRKKFARKRGRDVNKDVLLDSVTEIIRDSNVKEAWQVAHENEQRATILEAIRKIIPKLKPRQRQVAEIIKENFPNYLDNPEIKQQILKIYNENTTVLAVKSARQEVYKKLKDVL